MKRENPQATIDREEAIKRLPRSLRRMLEQFAQVPKSEFRNFPPDFIENLDHYLYGTPKGR